jgi:hypothetical protein
MTPQSRHHAQVIIAFLAGIGLTRIYQQRGSIIPPWPGWPAFCLGVGIPVLAVLLTYLYRRKHGHQA